MKSQSTRRTLLGMGDPDLAGNSFTLDYGSTGPPEYVLLTTMPLNQAELARLKLESEGIHCFISGQNMSVMHPLLFHGVKMMVNEIDLSRAREILDTPADDALEGEYVDEPWRCPECHRKSIEILSATELRKGAWYAWWILAVLVAVSTVVSWLNTVDPRAEQSRNASTGWALAPTMIAFGCVSLYLILGHREKRCTNCGWSSSSENENEPR